MICGLKGSDKVSLTSAVSELSMPSFLVVFSLLWIQSGLVWADIYSSEDDVTLLVAYIMNIVKI